MAIDEQELEQLSTPVASSVKRPQADRRYYITDQEAALRSANVQLMTGIRMRYVEQGDRDGHPVIMLHGYSDSWFSFSPVLPLLSPVLRIFALDQRGHGDSDSPSNGYALPDFAADVVAFMNAMEIQSATLIGHSMGSLIAQQVAAFTPNRVARLVLIGSAADARTDTVYELRRAVDSFENQIPVEFVREFQESTIFNPVSDDFLNRIITESLKLSTHVWHESVKGMISANYPLAQGRVRIPTLILWGEQDSVFHWENQKALLNTFENAVLKSYPETGHALHWERPEQFVADVQSFIMHAMPEDARQVLSANEGL